MQIDVSTAGQRLIDVTLQRHKRGVKVTVKVVPEVEDFFKQWGGGVIEGPTHGKMWSPFGEGEKLTLWTMEYRLGRADGMNPTYTLYHTGSGLSVDGVPNLSFLRLVGASEGRSFVCDNVMSGSELASTATRIQRAATEFYTEYILPVNMTVSVVGSTRDNRRDGDVL